MWSLNLLSSPLSPTYCLWEAWGPSDWHLGTWGPSGHRLGPQPPLASADASCRLSWTQPGGALSWRSREWAVGLGPLHLFPG